MMRANGIIWAFYCAYETKKPGITNLNRDYTSFKKVPMKFENNYESHIHKFKS